MCVFLCVCVCFCGVCVLDDNDDHDVIRTCERVTIVLIPGCWFSVDDLAGCLFTVSADTDGSHRRRVVQSAGGRHSCQRFHRPDAACVGRHERRVRAHAVRAHVHCTLPASPR